KRPERTIREPVVVAVDVRLVEPYSMQSVARILGRNLHAPRLVADLAIRGTRSPRDPSTMRVTHRWIECRHESARRLLHLDALRAAHVLIRLAIRDKYELAIVQ